MSDDQEPVEELNIGEPSAQAPDGGQVSEFAEFGKINGKRFDQWPAWKGQGIPLRENCDPKNPRQAFLWMFTALPGIKGGPLMMPTEYFELVSWRQWQLGARPQRKPTIKYQPPASLSQSAWTAQGKWVPLDTPDPPRKTLKDVHDSLPQADRAELRRIVLDRLGVDDSTPEPEPDEGLMQVHDLARRLDADLKETVKLLRSFGLKVGADSWVDRTIADRVIVHLGL